MKRFLKIFVLAALSLLVLLTYFACTFTPSNQNIAEAIYTTLNMKNETSVKGRRNMLMQKEKLLGNLELPKDIALETIKLEVFDKECRTTSQAFYVCSFKVKRLAPKQAEKTLRYTGVRISFKDGNYYIPYGHWLGRGSEIKSILNK